MLHTVEVGSFCDDLRNMKLAQSSQFTGGHLAIGRREWDRIPPAIQHRSRSTGLRLYGRPPVVH